MSKVMMASQTNVSFDFARALQSDEDDITMSFDVISL